MSLKKNLNASEKNGLTFDQVREAEVYLRRNKTQGILNDTEAIPLYELFLLGYAFEEIHSRFPQFSIGKIILTAALKGWIKDRETVANSIHERIRSRMIRSTINQVEFLTDMVSVATAESTEEMRKYIIDPKNNPPPEFRIKSIKEYQQVMEMMQKIAVSLSSAQPAVSENKSRLLPQENRKSKELPSSPAAAFLAEIVESDDE